MEPVDINAGEFYLRQLRSDDRVDDRAALVGGGRFAAPGAAAAHIAERRRQWEEDETCSWAVCEQLSNAAVGEIAVSTTGELFCWITPARRGKGIATQAVQAVTGFGFGFLDLGSITAEIAGAAGERVAQKCGFRSDGSPGVWTRLR
ncbi:GNAT family N-acetyltransferase [Saccharothrix algeriensis]|uniref:GNAT family N-acetyltransferase n=1 Tax=Saccharothrix algeriensis TaxID=173560 RepID=A0A8T8HSN0_9PSEU|nr:GNAT family protein [Saccharothrix algeriensis]MBM7812907.1 RimJ/RimL family protein N-acetyltransferase [Saccharothrix algeriensis]QTR01553.1 GNAT family N-acetyltransferase [Saccharothrix algeriensis]